MKYHFIFKFLFVLTLFFCVQAHAQAITIDQAVQVKQLFQNKLDEAVQKYGDNLIVKGDLLVEPTDSYYAVTMPQLMIKSKSGDVFDLGIYAINLVPAVDKKWLVTMAVPTQISVTDKMDAPLGVIQFGEQNLNGTWNENRNGFEKFNGTLGDVLVKPTHVETGVLLKKIDINGGLLPALGSSNNLIGNVNLGITGLDALTNSLQKLAADIMFQTISVGGNDQNKPAFAAIIPQALIGMTLLKSFGITEQTQEGDTVTKFNLELPTEGGARLNGKDVTSIVGLVESRAQAK